MIVCYLIYLLIESYNKYITFAPILNKNKYSIMIKADIVKKISENTGVDKTTVLSTVEAFMGIVKDSLTKEENVYLRGFGSFVVKRRAAKTARNIAKNTTIIIPAHNIPAFKPADDFLNAVKK